MQDKRENILYLTNKISQLFFEISLVSYLLFYLLDDLFENIVSNYFNLNILLVIVIISGVVMSFPVIKLEKKEKEQKQIGLKDYLMIIGLGIAAFGIIYYKLQLVFWLRLAVSVISGLIIILLSILLLNENNEENV